MLTGHNMFQMMNKRTVRFFEQTVFTAMPGASTDHFPDVRVHPEWVLEASLR